MPGWALAIVEAVGEHQKQKDNMLEFPHRPVRIKINQTSPILNFTVRDRQGVNLNVMSYSTSGVVTKNLDTF